MATETFGEIERMPKGRCCGATGVIENKLYLAGGFWQRIRDVLECRETWGFPFPKER
jgi:hypothetical protein